LGVGSSKIRIMKEDNIFNFEKLLVYQKSLEYIDFVYDLTEKFPHHELFGITSQYRRAANSIALNIAEGSGGTTKEFVNFLRISKRSIKECIVCTISEKRHYIKETDAKISRNQLTELSKMVSGLSNSISKSPDSQLPTKWQ
jgi:four helix bundle protein